MAHDAQATFAAVDLGASSGRVMVARVGAGPARPARGRTASPTGRCGPAGTLHWDVLGLYAGVLDGLRAAGRDAGRLDGVGIDSWAVDYGLLDADGALLGNPVHYRDARHATRGRRRCTPSSPPRSCTAVTGLQHLPFNTVFQLAARAGHRRSWPPPGSCCWSRTCSPTG